MAQKCAIGLISALAASASLSKSSIASADGPLNFSGFSTSPTQGSTTPSGSGKESSSVSGEESDAPPPRIRNDNPRTTSAGFDPEALERGAKTVNGINNPAHAKKVLNFYVCFFRIEGSEKNLNFV